MTKKTQWLHRLASWDLASQLILLLVMVVVGLVLYLTS